MTMKIRLDGLGESVPPDSPQDPFQKLADRITASGLVPEANLSQALAAAKGQPQELAKLLESSGLLTPYQFAAISEGRGASLRIGNYDVLDHLGAGAMGVVLKARHRRMKRIVALKVLAASLSKNEDFVRRFQREVETVARLGHPNIVMAYDADEAEAGHFLVMEFVSGRDLAACVEREGPFPVAQAVDAILQVARGMGYAHSQAIIHRDIKPQNLLRDSSGAVKVIDLGLARLTQDTPGDAEGANLTLTGTMMGTASYMPPEQAIDATKIDHRADIYSLGCTLYFLLTGKPPYMAPTIMSILLKHRGEEIPKASAVRPETPAQLDDLIVRMMAKRPEDRVRQMSDVVAELEAIAAALGPSAESAPKTTPRTARSDSTISTLRAPELTIAMPLDASSTSVLIVEPSRSQASIIKMYLQEQSFPVVGAVATGSEAIEAVRTLRPRVVISAMHLSDTSGVKLAQQIRSEIQEDGPCFLLITSESDDSESSTLNQLSRVLLLTKPFSATQLIEALTLVTGGADPRQSEDKPAKPAKTPRSALRVLIVDDSGTARMHQRSVLSGLGFSQFTEAADGAHAIAIAVRETFDLIITDYNMPLMDGRALVSYFKQNPSTAAVPIVMVTTETDPSVLDPVRQLGVVDILGKSFATDVVGPLLDKLF